ncbi:MAG: hypothetical protein ACFFDF_14525 [Candidatus Odinarchaeota archaeon]
MSFRDKISPLLIIGICILVPSIILVITFTLQAPYCSGYYTLICIILVVFSPGGIFIGGVLLFLGIYFTLKK